MSEGEWPLSEIIHTGGPERESELWARNVLSQNGRWGLPLWYLNRVELSEGVAASHNTEMTSPNRVISGCRDSGEELFQVQMTSMPGLPLPAPPMPKKTMQLWIYELSIHRAMAATQPCWTSRVSLGRKSTAVLSCRLGTSLLAHSPYPWRHVLADYRQDRPMLVMDTQHPLDADSGSPAVYRDHLWRC